MLMTSGKENILHIRFLLTKGKNIKFDNIKIEFIFVKIQHQIWRRYLQHVCLMKK